LILVGRHEWHPDIKYYATAFPKSVLFWTGLTQSNYTKWTSETKICIYMCVLIAVSVCNTEDFITKTMSDISAKNYFKRETQTVIVAIQF